MVRLIRIGYPIVVIISQRPTASSQPKRARIIPNDFVLFVFRTMTVWAWGALWLAYPLAPLQLTMYWAPMPALRCRRWRWLLLW
jgi:hypothetical protein